MKKYRQLTYTDRLQIEALLKAKHSQRYIAAQLGVTPAAICREIKKGLYMHKNSDWTYTKMYAAEKAQQETEERATAKGAPIKLGNDYAFANYVEYKIGVEKYSPRAVLGEIKKKNIQFDTDISAVTLYRYIHDGVFLTISDKSLPVLAHRKQKKYHKVRAAKPPRGTSIEKRPDEVALRNTFGHWEMDCVEGAKKTSGTLLVLTERLTREELIIKMKEKTTDAVVKALDRVERKLTTDIFKRIFRTITVDNGAEFMNPAGIQRATDGTERTQTFYCHPYCPSERGSNENNNRLIRRFYPKGASFADADVDSIHRLMAWINYYPRGILDYDCSDNYFQACLHAQGIRDVNVNKL
jgi:IS30 family transposase